MLSGLSGYLKGVKKAFNTNTNQAKPTLGKIRIGRRDLEEVKLISQGGYAYVFKVRDVNSGEAFALKKMICQSPERFQTAKNEIKFMTSLPSHPNLIDVYDTYIEKVDDCYYAYVLMELCEEGSVFDLMAKYESTKLAEKQIIFIMREICEGVKLLHTSKPPIAHRDLKIENILINNKKFKLCDFGSCSTSYVDFSKVPQDQYVTYEEEYDKNTTLMYRPPEMCDPYQKQIVSEKVDIWMLGCILYTMCFYKHPFQEMTKLSIVNAAYTFPQDHPYPGKLIDLIRIMLTPHPNYRPDIFEVCEYLQNYFSITSIQLNPDAKRIRDEQKKNAMEMQKFESPNSRKFQGDIPVEELMRLRQKVMQDDEEGSGNYGPSKMQNRQKVGRNFSGSPYKGSQHSQFEGFESFGQGSKKLQQLQHQHDHHQFNSSPGLQSNTKSDWYNFDNSSKISANQAIKVKGQDAMNAEENYNRNPYQTQPSTFSQFSSGNKGNQPFQSNQPGRAENKVNEKWQNFDFNSAQSNSGNNNSTATGWATSNWGTSNQASNQNNKQNTPQGNNNQNNTFQNFGGFSNNNNQPVMNNFSSSQNQSVTAVVTDNLLDLADTKPVKKDTAAGIMALYSMKA